MKKERHIMKKNNLKKAMLALMIASAAIVPSIKESHATTTTSTSVDMGTIYFNTLADLRKSIENAKVLKNKYQYLNAGTYYQQNFDNRLKSAEDLEKTLPAYSTDVDKYEKIKDAKAYLDQAIKDLDGKKVSTEDLDKLVKDDTNFMNSDAYKNAKSTEKTAYINAFNEARSFLLLNTDNEKISSSKLYTLTKNLEDARNKITNDYAPIANKDALKAEIKTSSALRTEADKYTKASFDAFISALRLAETSVEDKSSKKTAAEYKELTEALKTAREALVKVNKRSGAYESLIKNLEEAIKRNKIAISSAEFLLAKAPKQVAPVKGKLESLLKKSKADIEKAEKKLNELNGIKG